MKKKYLLILCLIFILLLQLFGCVPTDTDNTFTIGVSYDSNGAFPNKWISAFKKVSENENVNIIAVSAENDPAKQISDIERLITQGCDVILIRPKNTGSIVSALRSVNQAEIPCILIDFCVDAKYSDLYDVFLSEDCYEQGRLQAEFLKQWAKENPSREINIGYYSGPHDKQNSLEKRDAFYKEMGITSAIAEENCNWSITMALTKTESWLETYPQINVFVCMNDDMAAGAMQALKAANKSMDDYLILGMDGNANYKDSFISGDIDCTVVRDLEKEGHTIIEIAKGLSDGIKYEKTLHPDSSFLVTKENAAEYFGAEDID